MFVVFLRVSQETRSDQREGKWVVKETKTLEI